MHQYIFGQDEIVARFVAQLIPECRARGFTNCKTIGVADENGELLGGLVYRNWFPEVGTIEISGAALPETNWFSRRTIQLMHDYPFYDVGVQMVVLTTMGDNDIVQRILAAIGYTFYRIKRLGGRDRDAIIATLTVEQWEDSRYNAANRKRPVQHEEAA